MKIDNYLINILLLLLPAYFSQGLLYDSGSIISQIILVIIMLICGFYFIKTLPLLFGHNTIFNAWTLLLLLNIIGFVATANYSNLANSSHIKGILIGMMPFYPFFYNSRKGLFLSKQLIVFFCMMLIVSVYSYYFMGSLELGVYSKESEVINNQTYIFTMILPYVYLLKRNKIITSLALIIIIYFVISGAKRGAIIITFIGILIFIIYFIFFESKNSKHNKYFSSLLLITIIIIFSYYIYSSNSYVEQRFLQLRMPHGTSNRDLIYQNSFYKWYDSDNLIIYIFGYGFAETIRLLGTWAHNDWLELLVSFGLFGVLILAYLFYSLFKYITVKNINIENKLILITIAVSGLLISFYSMWYTSDQLFFHSILLGYFIGKKTVNSCRVNFIDSKKINKILPIHKNV